MTHLFLKLSVCFKTIIPLLLLFSLSTVANAERKVLWVQQEGGKGHDKIRAITVDAAGNSYVTGEFTNEAKIGKTTIVSKGKLDFLLCKYNPQGKLLWFQTAGGTEIDRGYSVAVDKDENVYVTGHFQSPTFQIGNQTLTNNGDYDYFLAKFSSAGKLLWAQSAGGQGYDYGHGVAVTTTGEIYTCGSFGAGDVTFGKTTSKRKKGRSMFVAKYNQNGKMLWSHLWGNQYGHSAHEVAVDSKGDCYVSGYMTGVVLMDGHQVGTNTKVRDIFVVKLTSQGKFLWGQTAGGKSDGLSTGVVVDQKGNVFISGMFKKEAAFGKTVFKSKGGNDAFIARINADGTHAWAQTGGGAKTDYGLAIAIDQAGNSYLTGELSDDVMFAGKHLKNLGGRDIYVAKFSPTGKLHYIQTMGGDKNDLSYAIAVDHNNNCFLSGAFSPYTTFQKHSLKSRGSNDIFLLKLR